MSLDLPCRLVYTCQKAQHKRCSFFLWSDDAKVREEAAVLNNSRSEPGPPPQPQTPRKTTSTILPPTPVTNRQPKIEFTAPNEQKEKARLEKEDSFDWSSSNDEDLLRAEQEVLSDPKLFETPRKAPRTATLTSPGKKIQGEGSAKSNGREQWPLSDDVFATPATTNRSSTVGFLSPSNTPSKLPSHVDNSAPAPEPSTLASEVLSLLHGVQLSEDIERNLIELLNKHDLRTQGISRGRDITRVAVQAKETKIAELQARIATLEGERETNRTVISLLKHDIATSPTKGTGRRIPPSKRSEV